MWTLGLTLQIAEVTKWLEKQRAGWVAGILLVGPCDRLLNITPSCVHVLLQCDFATFPTRRWHFFLLSIWHSALHMASINKCLQNQILKATFLPNLHSIQALCPFLVFSLKCRLGMFRVQMVKLASWDIYIYSIWYLYDYNYIIINHYI